MSEQQYADLITRLGALHEDVAVIKALCGERHKCGGGLLGKKELATLITALSAMAMSIYQLVK
jgi:hypothetical protein